MRLSRQLAHIYDNGEHGVFRPENYFRFGDVDFRVPNSERDAAGLPIDDDNDPAAPDRLDPAMPPTNNENALRQDLGLPHRDSYRRPPR